MSIIVGSAASLAATGFLVAVRERDRFAEMEKKAAKKRQKLKRAHERRLRQLEIEYRPLASSAR